MEAMREVGIDLSSAKPQKLTKELAEHATGGSKLGCNRWFQGNFERLYKCASSGNWIPVQWRSLVFPYPTPQCDTCNGKPGTASCSVQDLLVQATRYCKTTEQRALQLIDTGHKLLKQRSAFYCVSRAGKVQLVQQLVLLARNAAWCQVVVKVNFYAVKLLLEGNGPGCWADLPSHGNHQKFAAMLSKGALSCLPYVMDLVGLEARAVDAAWNSMQDSGALQQLHKQACHAQMGAALPRGYAIQEQQECRSEKASDRWRDAHLDWQLQRLLSGLNCACLSDDQLQCSICLDLMCEPVALSCGHIFCKRCIMTASGVSVATRQIAWVPRDQTCPNCRQDDVFQKGLHLDHLKAYLTEVKTSSRVQHSACT